MDTTKSVREREEKYRLIFENASEAIFIAQDDVIKFPNLRAQQMLGYSAEELVQQPFIEQIHHEDRAMVIDRHRRRLRGEVFRDTYDFRIVQRSGSEIWGQINSVMITWEGRPATLNFIREITEQKKLERLELQNQELREIKLQLEAMNTELTAKNAELERFTYTVSHDLKSPLLTIESFLGLLKQDLARKETRRLEADIEFIKTAATRMRRLLDELLELSSIGRVVDPSQQVSLAELGREAVELVAGKIAERGAAVAVSPNLPVVTGDRQRLLGVFQNLVDNAVKYMGDPDEPRIEIGTRQENGETVVYVRDNGTGIEPRHHETVFGLFEQLDAESEGTGFGLPLVRRIIEAHGGRVWVESEGQGQGSSFCIVLPLGR